MTLPRPLSGSRAERPRGPAGIGRGLYSNRLLIPVILVGLVLGVYPILTGIVLGFTNERVGGLFGAAPTRFVGFSNFVTLFGDTTFSSGLGLILVLGVVITVVTYVLAYLQAILLNQVFPLRRVVRAIALLPLAVAPVVVGEMFRYLFDPNVGSVNGLLIALGVAHDGTFLPTGDFGIIWLAVPAIWLALPFATIFLLASVQGVNQEVVEAAKVDGAGPVRRFWAVTFPETRGALAAVLPLSFAAQVAAFDIYFTLLGGLTGASSSNVFVPSIFGYFELTSGLVGRAAAAADVILVITLIAFLISRYIDLHEKRRA